MNRELIKQYKAEFDHWLDGGTLLARRWVIDDNDGDASYTIWYPIDSAFWEAEKIFNTSLEYDKTQFVINDEYVEFRKALAEGKTIQYYVDGFVGWQDVTSVADHPMKGANQYRIKPDKHKFKVGDWVIDKGQQRPYQIKTQSVANAYNSDKLQAILWRLKEGEYFLYNEKLARCNSISNECFNFTYVIENKTYMSNNYDLCSPFIGELPFFIKEQ